MAKAKPTSIRSRARLQEEATAFHSLDLVTGSEKLRPEDLLQREMPGRVQDAFVRGRTWKRENWLVEQICGLKEKFYNYGLEIKPKRKGGQLKDWLGTPQKRAQLMRYIRSTWSEWILQDTVVPFWRKEAKQIPFLLMPEQCEYSDAFGIEKLKYNFTYKKNELEGEGKNGEQSLDPTTVRRYANAQKITLSEEHDEYYQVLTRGLEGQGFGWPRLRTVFRTLSQNESMEVSESMLALASRTVIRRHKIGFEVKSGANSMRQEAFLYKKERALAIQNKYKGAAGFLEEVSQFDHTTEYIVPDPKLYDAKKWETIVNRMMWWGGPVAFIFLLKQPNPNLFQALEVEAEGERDIMRDHLEYVIKEGFGLDVSLKWGTRCFRDVRLGWQMVQALMQQGPLSLRSATEAAGYDLDEELEKKKAEKKDKENLTPLFDAAHGNRPGAQPGAGRPQEKSA